MTIIKFKPAPEGKTWNDEALRFFLKLDFPNTVDGVQGWIDLLDTGTITDDTLWQYIGKSHLLTVEEYAANLHKELQIVELTDVLEEFQQLAIRGNAALAKKDLKTLRLIIKEYKALFTRLFPDYGQQAGMVFQDVTFE